MVVPNYIPDPLEIPGNVTLEPHRVRLWFIRRVFSWHLLSLAIVAAVAILPVPTPAVPVVGLALLATLIGLCLVRIGLRGSKAEVVISAWSLAVLLPLVGLFARALWLAGVPVWAPLLGVGFAYFYALVCGRDFSFVGQYFLALLASTVSIAGISLLMRHEGPYAALALGCNLVYLSYYVYDGASLLSRRRLGEELGAVVDLYRDVLNLFGYVPRVVQHWHKHRIWQLR